MKKNILLIILCLTSILFSCSKEDPKRQIREMAETSELGTIEATVKKIIKVNDTEWYKIGERNILFRCKAYLKSGLDMSLFTEDDIVTDQAQKAVTVTLPAPKLLSLDLPIEEVELAYCHISLLRGGFSVADRNNILKQGEEDIRSDYRNLGLVEETKESATDLFTALLTQMGYKKITIKFKEEDHENE